MLRYPYNSGEREARDIILLPLSKWVSGGCSLGKFLTFKIYECVLIHFLAPKLLINYLTFMGCIYFCESTGCHIGAFPNMF